MIQYKIWAKPLLNSKAYKSMRREVLRRDQYTCRDCGGRGNQCDHYPIELTPDNISDPAIALNPDNCVTRCLQCHSKRTNGSSDVADGYMFDEAGQIVRRSM